MIIDLPHATSQDVAKRLVRLRHEQGAVTLGRVLTLLVEVDEDHADEAIEAANDATRQSPSRIIVLVSGTRRAANRLDAQIRLGGDAGASEIVVLRLYGELVEHGRSVVTPLLLADSPIVAWWPGRPPQDSAGSPLGSMAGRRITDVCSAGSPRKELRHRAQTYRDGDTDLAWTRITRWRGLLAAALDQPPYESVTEATVTGGTDCPSTDLLAGWLAHRLRCPVRRARAHAGAGVVSVRLQRRSGHIDLVRVDPTVVTLAQPGQPVRQMTLIEPTLGQALAEELRRLDPDQPYAQVLRHGLGAVAKDSPTASAGVRADDVPDVAQARRAGQAARQASTEMATAAMAKVPEPTADQPDDQVKKASARKLDAKRQRKPGTRGTTATAKPSGETKAKKSGGKDSAGKRSAGD